MADGAMMAPRLSLCILTINRVTLLSAALESALREAATVPGDSVEILVSDNGSTDGTAELVAAFQARWPSLRYFRFPGNVGFDANYLNCMEQARGDYVWIMGDDDAWVPGAVATVLRALEAGPDALLCAAMECDMEMRPTGPRSWFNEDPPSPCEWRMDSADDLGAYFNGLRYQAGAFAFISVAVIRRDRFMAGRNRFLPKGMGYNYIHLWGMAAFLQPPVVVAWIGTPLVFNRTGTDVGASADPWARGIHDLRVWNAVGNFFYASQPRLRDAFMGVLRRNHQDIMVRRMRMGAADDEGRWREARELLLAVGFDPLWVEVSDFLYRLYILDVPLSPQLRPEGICLADLPLAALGARRAAVLAPGLEALAGASGLLDVLRTCGRFERILVVCDPGLGCLLEGFDVLEVDPVAFGRDRALQDRIRAGVKAFRPGLLVNADRGRSLQGELLAASAQAPAALAFRGRPAGLDDELFKVLDWAYTLRLAPDVGDGELETALGLPVGTKRLWPAAPEREEAERIVADCGWTPGRILALGGDDPGLLVAPELPALLAALLEQGWAVAGIGGRGSFARLDPVLAPLGDRAVNLGGALGTGALAALLGLCGAHLGSGEPAVLARCMGCASAV